MLAMRESDPTPPDAVSLFEALEKKFPAATLGQDKWYLVAVSALSGSPHHEFISNLYTYMITKPEYSTPDSRKELVRRIREALVKDVSIVGVCKPIEAIIMLDTIERPEDKDYSFSREHWQSGPKNVERGQEWLGQIYQRDLSGIFKRFEAHKDFAWISNEITYGLYLSDHSILDGLSTELVVLAGIMIQNLTSVTAWHLRGMRRLGVSMEDVELVQQCIEMVAAFSGVILDKVPRVKDVEHEVQGC